jgi:phage recombination protein Bet
MSTQQTSALAVMAGRLQCDTSKLLDTLKATVFKGATNEELMALTVVANQYRLNPLTKELYAFPAKGGGIVPVVSIDGWLRIINDHPQMDGIETSYDVAEDNQPISCTATIWRKDRSKPIIVTEVLSECRRNTEPWKMPFRMLRHKAIIQCARVAFGFSGIMDEDEATALRPVTGTVVEKQPFAMPTAPAIEDKPAPAAKRAKKAEPAEAFALDAAPETAREKLIRLVAEDRLDIFKVDQWLEDQSLPPLSDISDAEAEGALGIYTQLLEVAK